MIQVFKLTDDWLNGQNGKPKLLGWSTQRKAHALAAITLGLRPAIAVDIGSYSGRSVVPVVLAMKEVSHGKVIAIDAWDAITAADGYGEKNAMWWKTSSNLTGARAQLQDMVKATAASAIVQIEAKRSDNVTVPEIIDLLHIDGQHTTEQATRDVDRFASKVRIGGVCVMDGIGFCEEDGVKTVGPAVERLLELGFVELYRCKGAVDDWMVAQRIDIA